MARIGFIYVYIIININIVYAQKIEWFLPWENQVSNLSTDKVETVPIVVKGANYRILRVSGFKNQKLSFKCNSTKAKVSFSYLPIIRNYSNQLILDAVLPIEMQELANESKYFLVKFEGLSTGSESISINISNSSLVLTKNVIVGNTKLSEQFDINVWAYFDYNLALKGKKVQVENMLKSNNINNIVIPPYVLPSILNKGMNFNRLEGYLPVEPTSFKRYFIFLNLDKKGLEINDNFKACYKNWILGLRKVFQDKSVPLESLYIYLVDEPTSEGIQFINNVIALDQTLGFNSNFYNTFGSNTNQVFAIKNNKTFLAQVVSKKINFKPKFTQNTFTYWTYDVIAKSRNIKPIYFISKVAEASNFNVNGIGVWNFCDINKAYSSADLDVALRNGSWKTIPTNPTYDYSLIYFDKNMIYPSLRLLALSCARDNYNFLKNMNNANSMRANRASGDISNNYAGWEDNKVKVLMAR